MAHRTLEIMWFRRSSSGLKIRDPKLGTACLPLTDSVDVGRLKVSISKPHYFTAP